MKRIDAGGDKGDSLKINRSGGRQGLWTDFAAGAGADDATAGPPSARAGWPVCGAAGFSSCSAPLSSNWLRRLAAHGIRLSSVNSPEY